MSFFAKLEQFCAGLIERTFAKTFPSDLEPAQIARKLVSTMEAQTRDDDGRLHAPGSYAVYVSPADFERLDEHRQYLERAWADLLRNLAAKVGVTFEEGRARVTMSSRESVPTGAVEIGVAQGGTARVVVLAAAHARGRSARRRLRVAAHRANRTKRGE